VIINPRRYSPVNPNRRIRNRIRTIRARMERARYYPAAPEPEDTTEPAPEPAPEPVPNPHPFRKRRPNRFRKRSLKGIPMPIKVSIQRLESYDPGAVDAALTALLEPLGGMGVFLDAGEPVLLKPNFLAPRAVDRAVATHPEVIRASARQARAAGAGRVLVSDSPGVGTATQCAARLGLASGDLLQVVDAGEGEWIPSSESGAWRLHLAILMRRHPLLNLAKVKTHGQMILSAAVKNTFGAVPGLEKAQWHYRMGRDPHRFARLLVHIHETVRPRLNIIDGVIGMEGNGPNSGTPRKLGILMAGENAHALDWVLARILNLNPERIYTLKAAGEMGVLPEEKAIEIVGPRVAELHPHPDWKLAADASVARIAGPGWLAPVMEKLLAAAPQVDPKICTLCLECVRHCAAGAMSPASGAIVIDKKKCISCFCCQEMCPAGAITVRSGPLARLLRLGR